jgi:DsbC/DsbD-like thiol-disulfide interchange protein
MHREIVGLLALSVVATAGASLVTPTPARHVSASLVAETEAVTPGRPLMTGLRLQMEPGWHTYWRNPGDSGLPTKIRWDLPEGFSAGEIQWPRPSRFNTGPLVSYGYHDEVLLPVEVEVPASLSSDDVHLKARVSWLECQEICLPGKADLELTLPVRSSAGAPGPSARLFDTARRELPRAGDGWRFSASAEGGTLALAVAPPRGTTVKDAYFYPVTRRVIDYSKPQDLRSSGERFTLVLPRDPNAVAVERLEGVLVGRTAGGTMTLAVEVALEEETR